MVWGKALRLMVSPGSEMQEGRKVGACDKETIGFCWLELREEERIKRLVNRIKDNVGRRPVKYLVA